MPRAGHSHTGMALCVVLAWCCLLLWKSPHTCKTASPTNHLHSPATAPKPIPRHTCCTHQRLNLTLQCPMVYPGLATHTLAGLCTLWLPSAASSSGNLHKPTKPQAQQTTFPALLQPPVQAPPNCGTQQRLHLALQCPMACPGLVTQTLARPCAQWLSSAVGR